MILCISWHIVLYPHYIVFSSFVHSKMILGRNDNGRRKSKRGWAREREREREYPTFCLCNLVSHDVGAWGIMQVLVVLWKIGYLHSTYKAHRWMRLSCGAPEPWQCGEPVWRRTGLFFFAPAVRAFWIGKSCGLERIEEARRYMRVNNHSVQERGFRRALHMPCAYCSPRRSLDAEYIMQISASPLISHAAPLDRN